ncbi:hypothetical protein FKM82_027827 [Ascaphus truei]
MSRSQRSHRLCHLRFLGIHKGQRRKERRHSLRRQSHPPLPARSRANPPAGSDPRTAVRAARAADTLAKRKLVNPLGPRMANQPIAEHIHLLVS